MIGTRSENKIMVGNLRKSMKTGKENSKNTSSIKNDAVRNCDEINWRRMKINLNKENKNYKKCWREIDRGAGGNLV